MIEILDMRELTIVHMMGMGWPNKEIARYFCTGDSNVKRWIAILYGKLGLPRIERGSGEANRTRAAIMLYRWYRVECPHEGVRTSQERR